MKNTKCGPYRRVKPPIDGLYTRNELNEDVKSHLVKLIRTKKQRMSGMNKN